MKKTTSPYIVIKRSRIHHIGAFAKKKIPKGTRIIEYVGEKVTKAESYRRAVNSIEASKKKKTKGAVYMFDLNKRYDIDGDVSYNTARFINHSCDPNCEPQIIRGHIWIIAIQDIEEGEELCYNYGYDFESYEEHPCRCGSPRCVGYILAEEHWPKLRRKLRKIKRKRRQPR